MTDPQDAPIEVAAPDPTAPDSAEPGGYGVGPFTVREVSLLGVWLVAFLVSFFPVAGPGTPSVWTSGLLWILTIGVPTAAVGLIVLRRFSPDGIRRVGSLGVDQFASVAFSVAAVVWLQFVWASISFAIEVGGFPGSWVQWVELILMLAGVVLTVFAPLVPVFAADFRGRREIPAVSTARPVRPVVARPAHERAPRPPREPKAPKGARRSSQPGGDPAGAQGYDPNAAPPQGYDTGAYGRGYDPSAQQGYHPAASAPQQGFAHTDDPFAALAPEPQQYAPVQDTGGYAPAESPQPTADQPAAQQPPAQQAFWALVPVERDVVDQHGVPLFRIGPTAWALVIEDQGNAFVVRDEDGRTGYLLDVSGVMRG